MGAPVELKEDPAPATRPLMLTPPKRALPGFNPGMSPYVHRWLETNGRLPEPNFDPVGTPLSEQVEVALEALIENALSLPGGGKGDGDKPDGGSRRNGAAASAM